jgi:REP element-mobilizing transposase RayT
MNINQNLIALIQKFNSKDLEFFLRDKSDSFEFPREKLYFDKDKYQTYENAELLATNQLSDGTIIVCTILVTKDLTERSSKKLQFDFAKDILKNNYYDAGIFVFYDADGHFRFSLIYAEYYGNKRSWNSFKRFTYYVSKELTNKTFLDQISNADFSSIEALKKAFSVEPVTKQFYNEIQSWYFWAMDKISFPTDYKYSDNPAKDDEIRNSNNLIRLITRIIFIWFIKQKNLINEDIFSEEKLKNIIKDFNKNKDSANYYNAILQNLFFATLNQKINEREFAENNGFNVNKKQYGVKNLYRYDDLFLITKDEVKKLFIETPFLNGGLFDCLDKEDENGKVIYIDGFSRNPNKRAIIPDYLFFQNEEKKVDLSKYGLRKDSLVRGLINILQSYNFTIDENTLIDQEVALDPELLGKVFENLLASYNPETASTARKATGSYYTPREIVDYMVHESLFYYLKSKCPDIDEAQIRNLLSYAENTLSLTDDERNNIIKALDDIKILDPACGSGAFPMGALHMIVNALQKLDPDNNAWKNLQMAKVTEETQKIFKENDKNEREVRLNELNNTFDESINYPDYARKLFLIENCIYGVDIQTIAIQISKLRFFISLVIDQRVDKTRDNLGIRALPNMETRFVAANTLIELEKPDNLFYTDDIQDLEKELKQLRHKYFSAKTRQEKLTYQQKDKELRDKLSNALKQINYNTESSEKIAKFDIYDPNASADWFDPEWMFGVTDGFDVVIGNPPYIQLQKAFNAKMKYADLYKNMGYETFDRTGDIYCLFYERGVDLLKNDGILCYISSNKWMRAGYGEKMRAYFMKYNPLLLIDLGPGIFENATVDTCIFLLQKAKPTGNIPVASQPESTSSIPVASQSESTSSIPVAMQSENNRSKDAPDTIESKSTGNIPVAMQSENNRSKDAPDTIESESTGNIPVAMQFENIEADWDFFNASKEVIIHIGKYLPHWRQKNVWYFVTFRLYNSIPKESIELLKEERQRWLIKTNKKDFNELTDNEKQEFYRLFSRRIEQILNSGYSSHILMNENIAKIVADALLYYNNERYILDDWVIMPNHVHVLVKPLGDYDLSNNILHTWKSYTANEINKILGQKGQFWSHESYDHIVRDEESFYFIKRYIRNNPAKAGIILPQISQSWTNPNFSDNNLVTFGNKDAPDTLMTESIGNIPVATQSKNHGSKDAPDTLRTESIGNIPVATQSKNHGSKDAPNTLMTESTSNIPVATKSENHRTKDAPNTSKSETTGKYSLRAVTLQKDKDLPLSIEQQVKEKAITLSNLSKDTWFIAGDAEQKLNEKIEQLGKPLKDWDVKIYYGIKTGFNDAFIIDSAKRQEILDNCQDEAERERTEKIIKPILRGRDIKRYYYEWAGLWVIITKFGFYREADLYPAIVNHLKKYEMELKNRGQCRYTRQNKAQINKDYYGQHHWLELDNNPQDFYLKEFEKEKIVWGNISYNSQFSYIEPGIFINAPANIIVSEVVPIKYLIGIMNSKVFDMEFKRVGIFLGNAFEWKKQYVEQVRIPLITETNEPIVHQIESLVDKILTLKKENHQSDTTALEHEIDELVYRLYDLTEDEIKIVEGKN